MAKGLGGSKGYGSNDNPTTGYAKKSFGGGRSRIVGKSGNGGSTKFIASGVQAGDKMVGTKRFDLGSRSLNRGSRGMK